MLRPHPVGRRRCADAAIDRGDFCAQSTSRFASARRRSHRQWRRIGLARAGRSRADRSSVALTPDGLRTQRRLDGRTPEPDRCRSPPACPKVAAAAQPMFEQARDSYARLLAAARGRCDRSGIPTKLSHSGASVRLPDFIQFRADGTNAVAGITPDVLVPWRLNDSDYQRAERAYEALAAAIGVH